MDYIKAIGLAIIATALLFLFIHTDDNNQIMGLGQEQFASLAFSLTLLVTIGARLLIWDYRNELGKFAKQALIWCGIFAVIVVSYILWEDLGYMPGRIAGGLRPGYAAQNKEGETIITRNQHNDFLVIASINGKDISFIFDTGADSIVLQYETAASALGMTIPPEQFQLPVLTANGRTQSAAIMLDNVTVGSISLNHVDARVSQPGKLHQNLLGMSFLNRLSSYEVRGNKLILRP